MNNAVMRVGPGGDPLRMRHRRWFRRPRPETEPASATAIRTDQQERLTSRTHRIAERLAAGLGGAYTPAPLAHTAYCNALRRAEDPVGDSLGAVHEEI